MLTEEEEEEEVRRLEREEEKEEAERKIMERQAEEAMLRYQAQHEESRRLRILEEAARRKAREDDEAELRKREDDEASKKNRQDWLRTALRRKEESESDDDENDPDLVDRCTTSEQDEKVPAFPTKSLTEGRNPWLLKSGLCLVLLVSIGGYAGGVLSSIMGVFDRDVRNMYEEVYRVMPARKDDGG